MIDKKIITIERFLLDRQPESARGDLTAILYDLALGAKIIAAQTRRAGLLDVLGFTDHINVQGEQQRKLDAYADNVITRLILDKKHCCALVSEEQADIIYASMEAQDASYILFFDPLDGSSNTDANISIGTIFGVYQRLDAYRPVDERDCLQPGKNLVAAGYILYGTSTMLVYSAGHGVHGFTLDPILGEFILSHENIRYGDPPKYFSFNVALSDQSSEALNTYLGWLKTEQDPALTHRYVGSMVADFHRNLIHGGVFAYPAAESKPDGKIRILYEAAPLAFIAENAGGYGSDGSQSLLEIVPNNIHQRVPVFIGNRNLVEKIETWLSLEKK